MDKSAVRDQHSWSTLSYLSGGIALLSTLFLDTDVYLSTSSAVLAIIFGVCAVKQFNLSREKRQWVAICSIAIGSFAVLANIINLVVYYLEI
ncbi:hypothetical protein [Truepera radiovictrix]|uniref:hypothetical protein n=1 Tax=Truepera radiovictrix TaxID=332249 RepID=UPI0011D06DD3|nr:hypothetical protein [Truepera radiovictrix]WMT56166.1 hypothetical protein RCV51_09110 [Truepera radiovictrix]